MWKKKWKSVFRILKKSTFQIIFQSANASGNLNCYRSTGYSNGHIPAVFQWRSVFTGVTTWLCTNNGQCDSCCSSFSWTVDVGQYFLSFFLLLLFLEIFQKRKLINIESNRVPDSKNFARMKVKCAWSRSLESWFLNCGQLAMFVIL